jgi:hypothetical protein
MISVSCILYSTRFNKDYWVAAERVLRYLARTLNYGLNFQKSGKNVKIFTNTDWAGDTVDQKSYTGFVVNLGASTVNWESRKQSLWPTLVLKQSIIV